MALMAAAWLALHPAPLRAQPATAPATVPATQPEALDVAVDLRVELVCVIFRLAGHPEYQSGRIESYRKDVDEHFAPVRDHAVVQLARQLRRTRGVSFDAPMSLAAHISPPPALAELVPFDQAPPGLDSRWKLDEVRRFLELARDFAKAGKFDEFARQHRELYDTTAKRLRETMQTHGHLEWFDRFFGARPGARFHLTPALLNGGNCYGASCTAGDQTHLYSMLGVWEFDKEGLPAFPRSVVPTIVHEFGHSYVNPIVDRHREALAASGKKLFAGVEQQMRRQAYGQWDIMMREAVLRACVVRYRLAHESVGAGVAEVLEQRSRGFAWTGELSGLLAEYEKQRDQYPDFESFMPRIVRFFDDYAEKK